jgi:predicted DCC family thiol-disulfide oxidoreductase YuxK
MNQAKRAVLLFDGKCSFCAGQVEALKKLVGKNAPLVSESFHNPGVLARYPGLTHEECMKEIKLVTADSRILGGAHAIFYALSLNPLFLPVRWLYPLPILKQIIDGTYRFVARNRYKIQTNACPTGTCPVHGNHKFVSEALLEMPGSAQRGTGGNASYALACTFLNHQVTLILRRLKNMFFNRKG